MKIAILNGDGISSEIIAEMKKVVDAAFDNNSPIEWTTLPIGRNALEKHGEALPKFVLEELARHTVAIKGPAETPESAGYRSVNVELRKHFQLHACIRPIRISSRELSQIKRNENVDFVIFRENLEDLYAGIEFGSETEEDRVAVAEILKAAKVEYKDTTVAIGLKTITSHNSSNLMCMALEYARANGRKKITVVAKANIMKKTDGLFVKSCQAMFDEYGQGLELEFLHVDDVAEKMITGPRHFDVIVTENVYGDILSSLGAGIIGGVQNCPGANIGENFALFEATHGTAPSIAGKNIASPVALILSAEMMLRHLQYKTEADAIRESIDDFLSKDGQFHIAVTTTTDRGDWIAKRVKLALKGNVLA